MHGWDEYALTFSVGLDPVAALAAVELLVAVVVVDGRSGATKGGAVGAAAEPRRALLLAAPELGRRRLGGLVGATAAALAALLGQVPRQGRALRVHFPVEDLEDLQMSKINASLFQNWLIIFLNSTKWKKNPPSNQFVNSRI